MCMLAVPMIVLYELGILLVEPRPRPRRTPVAG